MTSNREEFQEHRSVLPKGFRLNEYSIEKVLGKPGGFGITYLATDSSLERSIAIKEYLPTEFAIREGKSTVCVRSASDEDNFKWGLDRFAEEAKVLARFSHPNIVKVLRFFRENGTAYMVMEYQEGRSLTEYLKERGGILTENELLAIIIPLAEGLHVIHQAGFLHRDIKPSNIYIRNIDNSPILLDFGSARYAVGQRSLSVTSIVSPGYAPLEQYGNDIDEQGPWTDIYALGAVMYCAIKGEPPPAATSRVMKDPIVPATQIGQGKYNNNLLMAIDWALEVNAENRPQSIDGWRQKLSVLPTVVTRTISQSYFKQHRVAQNRQSLLTLAGILILLLTVAVGLLYHQNQEANQARSEIAKQLLDEQEKLVAERKLRETEQTARAQAEEMIEQIKRFEDQTTIIDRSRFEEIDPKEFNLRRYYDIVHVEADDTLNIRVFPGTANEVIGTIPPDGKCIPYLNKLHIYKALKDGKISLWVKINYQGIEGWVHSYFLTENTRCHEFSQ